MGTFNTKAILNGKPSLIPAIADRICQEFAADGYEVKREDLIGGGQDISLTKGNLFKTALGMSTALKITLSPLGDGISFEAGVGIFGMQAIPTIIIWFYAWPVLLTQIWGMVQQSKLDDKALAIAQRTIDEHACPVAANVAAANVAAAKFCTNCGTKVSAEARFCPNCGTPLC